MGPALPEESLRSVLGSRGFHIAACRPEQGESGLERPSELDRANLGPRESSLYPDGETAAPVASWGLVNGFVPQAIVRKLSREEMKAYRAPFPTVASRKPIRQWPREIPFSGSPADVHEIVRNYRQWLEETELPKLMFHASPGAIITPEVAESLKAKLKNLEAIDLGEGIHCLQEDHPHAIGEGIAEWYRRL